MKRSHSIFSLHKNLQLGDVRHRAEQYMQTKNDEWIEKIRELQSEMQVFQAAGTGTPEIGYALHYLKTARFWIQEDKANITSNPGEVAHREA